MITRQGIMPLPDKVEAIKNIYQHLLLRNN